VNCAGRLPVSPLDDARRRRTIDAMRLARQTLPALAIAGGLLAGGLAAGRAQASPGVASGLPPALSGTGFSAPATCPSIDAFGNEDPQRLEQRLDGRCRVPRLLGRSAPMVEGGGQRGTWRLEQQVGVERGSLAARLQVQLKAIVDGAVGAAALTPQTEFAAGLWWQPLRDFALQLRHGERRQADGAARRTELTGAWRMTADALLYSGWTGLHAMADPRVGLRWWLVPGVVLLEVAVPVDGIALRPLRLQLNWRGFAR